MSTNEELNAKELNAEEVNTKEIDTEEIDTEKTDTEKTDTEKTDTEELNGEEPNTVDMDEANTISENEEEVVIDIADAAAQPIAEDGEKEAGAPDDDDEPKVATESAAGTESADEAEIETEPTADEIIAKLEAALAEAEQRADSSVDKLQRTAAEFQNSKRRQAVQLADSIERAGTHMIQQLLPVLDDLELAFNNLPEGLEAEQEAWLGGFEQIQKKLLNVLDSQGVTVIDEAGLFDPTRHEAVSSEPNDDVESGHIIAVLRTGYELKGRVLRPALVRVAM